jgi:hypothetical protein
MHYTSTMGDSASFTFTGTQFILTYTQATNRGNIDMYLDGTKVGTLNANGVLQWQSTYTSPVFPAGTHLLMFKHAGGGAYIDVDSIQVLATAAPGVGRYDDVHTNWVYTGSWTKFSGSGPYSNTLRYTTTVGDAASFTFTGTQFILTYTQAANRGNIDVYVDEIKVDTIHANGPMQWQKLYISPVYANSAHVVKFMHNGGGTYMDVDAIEVRATAAPGVSATAYDDANVNWTYTGAWTAHSGGGPGNNTMHYTATVGDSASFIFTGTQFILTYTQALNRGNIDMYVDGSKVGTINANGAMLWQKTYTSPVFPVGTHVVQFKHAGGGTYIDVDAIQVLATAAPEANTYEDVDPNWSYSGAWSAYTGSGPHGDNFHYTATAGDSASFTFTGTQFILTYIQSPARGNIDVYLDGVKVTTINANGVLLWQKTYASLVFSAGTHVVQFAHGGGGTYIDIDALQIQ